MTLFRGFAVVVVVDFSRSDIHFRRFSYYVCDVFRRLRVRVRVCMSKGGGESPFNRLRIYDCYLVICVMRCADLVWDVIRVLLFLSKDFFFFTISIYCVNIIMIGFLS